MCEFIIFGDIGELERLPNERFVAATNRPALSSVLATAASRSSRRRAGDTAVDGDGVDDDANTRVENSGSDGRVPQPGSDRVTRSMVTKKKKKRIARLRRPRKAAAGDGGAANDTTGRVDAGLESVGVAMANELFASVNGTDDDDVVHDDNGDEDTESNTDGNSSDSGNGSDSGSDSDSDSDSDRDCVDDAERGGGGAGGVDGTPASGEAVQAKYKKKVKTKRTKKKKKRPLIDIPLRRQEYTLDTVTDEQAAVEARSVFHVRDGVRGVMATYSDVHNRRDRDLNEHVRRPRLMFDYGDGGETDGGSGDAVANGGKNTGKGKGRKSKRGKKGAADTKASPASDAPNGSGGGCGGGCGGGEGDGGGDDTSVDSAGARCVILLGDNLYWDGIQTVTDARWQEMGRLLDDMRLPVYAVLGNHDHDGRPRAQIKYTNYDRYWHMPDFFYKRTFVCPPMEGPPGDGGGKFRSDVDTTNFTAFADGESGGSGTGDGGETSNADDGLMTVDFWFLDTHLLSEALAEGGNGTGRANMWSHYLGGESEYFVAMGKEHMQWLEQSVAASTADWKFMCGHFPVYNNGHYGDFPELQPIEALCAKYNIDAMFSGHEHCLQKLYRDSPDGQYTFRQFVCGSSSHVLSFMRPRMDNPADYREYITAYIQLSLPNRRDGRVFLRSRDEGGKVLREYNISKKQQARGARKAKGKAVGAAEYDSP